MVSIKLRLYCHCGSHNSDEFQAESRICFHYLRRLCTICVENYAPLSYYTANSGKFPPTFRDNLSVPYSRVKNTKYNCALLGYYAVNSSYFLSTFRDNLSVPWILEP